MKTFQHTQQVFTRHLRSPAQHPAPPGIEDRRMGIYRDLVYNNIAAFIAGAFPIIKEILDETYWHTLVRDFVTNHTSQTPYFLEISQEFLAYLAEERAQRAQDPPFLLELAHYEWVELALDVAEEDLPTLTGANLSLLDNCPQVSPLAWCLAYQFPVHKIGAGYQPQEPESNPVFLIAYRDRKDMVKFMEVNALSYGLLQLLQDNPESTGRAALEAIAAQMQHPNPAHLLGEGGQLLQQLLDAEIIVGIKAFPGAQPVR